MPRKGKKAAKKGAKVKPRKAWPMRIVGLIVSAIQDLRETKGSTPKRIIGYISYVSEAPDKKVKRQVKAVLKRGVEYGILRKHRGHYFLPTGNELDRANRVALRFAKLPLPPAYSLKSSAFPLTKAATSKGPKKSRTGVRSLKKKRVTKSGASLISPTISIADAICSAEEL